MIVVGQGFPVPVQRHVDRSPEAVRIGLQRRQGDRAREIGGGLTGIAGEEIRIPAQLERAHVLWVPKKGEAAGLDGLSRIAFGESVEAKQRKNGCRRLALSSRARADLGDRTA